MKLKNIVTLILSALLLCSMVVSACAESDAGHESGAWETCTNLETATAEAALEKAQNGLDGAVYEAIAVLGTQIVSGTNTCILCRITPVVPDAMSAWALVYVYEDLEGNAEITDIVELMPVPDENMTGAWNPTQSDDGVEADAMAAFAKALEGIDGADYEAIACLGSQVVAGTNYCLLCRVTPVVLDAESSLCLVTVYQNLEGEAAITEICDLEIADTTRG